MPAPAASARRSSQASWGWTVGLVCVATFMVILDLTVVNVALPEIQASFHSSLTDLEWVVNTYALLVAGLLLVAGSTGDRVGRRLIFVAGMVVFTGGSLLSALAPSTALLIAFRGLQGFGAALLFSTALGILGNLFQGEERARALGLWGVAIGAGLACGPLVGGLLTQLFGWPAIFLVNLPIGVAVVGLSLWRMPESKDPSPKRIDKLGAGTLALGLVCLVFALVEGNTLGWDSPLVLGGFLLAIGIGAVFVRAERRPEPIAPLGLLADPRFRAASVGVFGQGLVIGAMLFYLVRFLQQGLGDSPLVAGLVILPMTVTAMGAALVGSRLAAALREEVVIYVSLLLMAVGSALMLLLNLSNGWYWLLPGLLLAGMGWGAINPASAHAALATAPPDQSGMASGFVNTARQIGIASGLGGLGAFFELQVRLTTLSSLAGLPAHARTQIALAASRSGLPQALMEAPSGDRERVDHAVRTALLAGLHAVLLAAAVGAVLVAASIILAAGRGPRSRAV
ncbi:MAG TPA: MFS transporter [Candidatus Dormibacteraeota bacterium]